MTSKTVARVMADLEARAALGMSKYGVTLDRTDLSRKQWLQHAYEEALDMGLLPAAADRDGGQR